MEKKNKIGTIAFLIIFIALIIFSVFTFYKVTKINSDISSIKIIQTEINSLKRNQEKLKDPDYNKLVSLETKHQQFVNEINKQNNRMEFLAWLISSATIITIIVVFIEYYSKFKKRVDNIIAEQTQSIVKKYDKKYKAFWNLLISTDFGIKAIDNLKIKIFFLNQDNIDLVIDNRKKYFKQMGFKLRNSDFIKVDNFNKIEKSFEKTDIIFFDNYITDELPTQTNWLDQINKWMKELSEKEEKNNNSAFFYFGQGRFEGFNFDASYANSIYSLYHNLIDLMRYKYVMDKND